MIPLVSVVIPVYNVEKYLINCIDSIRNQPYENLEIIIVNDGSTDNSGSLCNSLAANDKRVTAIHKDNGGLCSARNAGLEVATGKYIVFIDPDDQISSDYILTMVEYAEKYMCEVVVSGFKTFPNNQQNTPGFKHQEVMNGKELILSSPNVHSNNDLCFVWRYMYKLSFLQENKIRFNEDLRIVEDAIFNLEVLLKSTKAIAIPNILYIYTVNNANSIMRTPYKPQLDTSLVVQYKCRKDLSYEFGLMDYEYYRCNMAYYHIDSIYNLLTTNLKNSEASDIKLSLKRIVNYSLIRDSVKEIGLSYKCNNLKEYIFYLALKLRVYPVLLRELKK